MTSPRKTDLAIAALQSHRSPLTLLQRRALILADGQRDLASLGALLGTDAAALVQTLCAAGYLHWPTDPAVNATVATAVPASHEEEQQRQQRRALTSARLYLLDILQLQRNPAALALHGQLQAARSAQAMQDAIAEALAQLPQITSASYAERVRDRVTDLLPPQARASTSMAAAERTMALPDAP
ncbi:hypothetical protein [Xanthomonas maliensis]|uniref:hypothetical protein n=1 Tax=Xanthomonas maliensis TaxID=1321368 RepID=UPI0003AA2F9B|nr:hypothetical protein [Xanthomonas maliensis]KAB7768588.1 hypothetical protein CKY51_09075 [Xanthomonas maliensis]